MKRDAPYAEIPHQRRCRVLVEEFAGFDAYGVELRVSDNLAREVLCTTASAKRDEFQEAASAPRA